MAYYVVPSFCVPVLLLGGSKQRHSHSRDIHTKSALGFLIVGQIRGAPLLDITAAFCFLCFVYLPVWKQQ